MPHILYISYLPMYSLYLPPRILCISYALPLRYLKCWSRAGPSIPGGAGVPEQLPKSPRGSRSRRGSPESTIEVKSCSDSGPKQNQNKGDPCCRAIELRQPRRKSMRIQSHCLQTGWGWSGNSNPVLFPPHLQHCSLPSVSPALRMQAPLVPGHLAVHGRGLPIRVAIQVLLRLMPLEQSIGLALHQRRGFPTLFEDLCLKRPQRPQCFNGLSSPCDAIAPCG